MAKPADTVARSLWVERLRSLVPAVLRKRLRRLRAALNPDQRRKWHALRAFAARHSRLLGDRAPLPAARKTLLVATGGASAVLPLEMTLVKALQQKGFRPVILGPDDDLLRAYYRLWGIDAFVSWQDLSRRPNAHELPAFSSFADVVAYRSGGARVGKYAASWVMRRLRVGRVDPSDGAIWAALLRQLRDGVGYASAAAEALDRFSPDAALFLEHGYTPWGELFDLCVSRGIDAIQWNACHRDNALMLKRYGHRNAHMHPASLSDQTWRTVLDAPWDPARSEQLRRELSENYENGQWFGEVGTQFNKRLYARADLQRLLGLDPSKKTAVVLPHLFWDATFFYGRDLFEDYQDWFIRALEAAAENPHLNWVVKIHPANLVKSRRDGVTGESSEKRALVSRFRTLPTHFRLIEADSDVSTFSLFSLMDYCLTVRGTIGIEAAAFGIPVVTAGTGRYDRLGFTLDPETREEYLDLLRRLHEVPPLAPEQRQRAERYAHALFLARPLSLHSVTLEYAKDERATPTVDLRLGSLTELAKAEDLQAFAEWVDSGSEDFLDRRVVAERPVSVT